MKDKHTQEEISELRRRAEELAHKTPEEFAGIKPGDLQALVHELHVHQIELEMQNEELMDTRRRLEDARDRYTDLFDNAPVGYLVLDKSGKVSEANLKAAQMLELQRWELVGRPFTEFVERESQDVFYLHRRDTMLARVPLSCELELVRTGGEAFHAVIESVAVEGPDGEPGLIKTTISDITARKEAEHHAADLSEKLQLIAEEATVGVHIIQGTRFAYVNKRLGEILGYTREEALDIEDIFELVHPGDREMMADYNRRLYSGEIASAQCEFRALRKDGGVKHIEFFGYGTTFRGLPAIAGVGVDITARKEAEAAREFALEKAEAGRRTLKALMEYVPLGIVIADAPDAAIKMVSKKLLDIVDKDEKDLIGVTGEELPQKCSIYQTDGLKMASPEDLALNRAVRDGETVVDEKRLIKRPDGSFVPLLCSAGPIRDKDGNVTGGVIALTDLSRIEKDERDRTNFYAMVSHDIRSPLSAIIGNAEFLLSFRKGKLDDDTQKILANMLKSCEKIRGLVDDFLAHSRLEAGGAVLNFKRVDAAQILADVYEEFSPQAKKKGVGLIVEAAKGLPKAYIDRKHVVRALSNLVQNALDYTPKGGRVSVKAEQAEIDGEESLVYTVSDNGPGVPPGEQALIFEKYYRSPSVRGMKGTGLGLAIARAVAEAHAGRVELASEPGKGSTFRLVLPVIAEKE